MAEAEGRADRHRERALANPTRLVLLALLAHRELSARELRSQLPDELALTAVVYHLAILQDAELVAAPLAGRYRLA
jgi:DNA-binding transcriptional ArsR family regulator